MSSEHWWDVNDSAKDVPDGDVIEEVGVSYNGVNCDNTSMENITISLNTNTTTIEEEAIGKEDGCGNKRLNTSIDEPASLPEKTLPSNHRRNQSRHVIKKNLNFLYGKWTEFIRCTDVISYEEYMRKNVHKFRREGDSKGKSTTPNESPLHNPKTVLSKLNSLKVSPFKSSSQAETCFRIRTLKETVKSFPPHEADDKVERRVLVLGNVKKNLNFLYGKWTEFIRCTDVISYEEYMRKNVHKFRREGDSKGKSTTPNESPLHNPKTVLSKLNSLKVSPFKSSSQAETCFRIRTLKETVKSFPPHEADDKVERRVLVLGNGPVGATGRLAHSCPEDKPPLVSMLIIFTLSEPQDGLRWNNTGSGGWEEIPVLTTTGNVKGRFPLLEMVMSFASGRPREKD
uniref:Uncharacterized protein n=1 Tax=Timema poppense TaxID=170557 RepID=A0A7R9H6Y6_TIMPO|nr:unnamed protein product [Timema poppensis]